MFLIDYCFLIWANWLSARTTILFSSTITLVAELQRELPAGKYQLLITQQKQNHSWTLNMPFDVDLEHELCMPFEYSIVIAPIGVISAAIEPPGITDHPPGRDLVVTVSFSDAVYTSTGIKVIRILTNKCTTRVI